MRREIRLWKRRGSCCGRRLLPRRRCCRLRPLGQHQECCRHRARVHHFRHHGRASRRARHRESFDAVASQACWTCARWMNEAHRNCGARNGKKKNEKLTAEIFPECYLRTLWTRRPVF